MSITTRGFHRRPECSGSREVIRRNVPGERWYGLLYADWPGLVAVGEEARCVGDVIAAVAAVDRPTARRAVELIEATWEVLPAVLDPVASIARLWPRRTDEVRTR